MLNNQSGTARAGRYVRQPQDYRAFIPAPLPPDPPVAVGQLASRLSEADRALGELVGVTTIIPNPDLFVGMYVRKEAVLSSEIEGTQASLAEILEFEISEEGERLLRVEEVVNHVRAMNYGLRRLNELPLSLRLIREIHAQLMEDVRGHERSPGEFRRTQNWIGPAGSTIREAIFVPPPPSEVMASLGNLEEFMRTPTYPPLVDAGIAHAHFETIHPFLDGNGRIGRLLITFLLCERGVLPKPLLYLSHFLRSHRAEYYDRLQAVRTDGHWEEWLLFFLRGIKEVATGAASTGREILRLREKHRELLSRGRAGGGNLPRLLDLLFENPIVTVNFVSRKLDVSYVTANTWISRLVDLGILTETTGYQRNRRFSYDPYLELFDGTGVDELETGVAPESS